MAKGQQSKTEILNKMMRTFDGAFLYNDGKELRIPMIEDGQEVQIKVALTCAKDNVVPGQDNALPGEINPGEGTFVQAAPVAGKTISRINPEDAPVITKPVEPTAEEKANVKNLLQALGL